MAIDTIEIRVSDVDDARQVLAACFNYFLSRDIQQAQIDFRAQRPSPLTGEVERIKARFDGYFSDFLLAEHEATLAESDTEEPEDAEAPEEADDGSDEPTDPLSGSPLGTFTAPKQKGRRLKAGELGS